MRKMYAFRTLTAIIFSVVMTGCAESDGPTSAETTETAVSTEQTLYVCVDPDYHSYETVEEHVTDMAERYPEENLYLPPEEAVAGWEWRTINETNGMCHYEIYDPELKRTVGIWLDYNQKYESTESFAEEMPALSEDGAYGVVVCEADHYIVHHEKVEKPESNFTAPEKCFLYGVTGSENVYYYMTVYHEDSSVETPGELEELHKKLNL